MEQNRISEENLLDLLQISLGTDIMKYLEDPAINEVMANDDGKVFVDHYKDGMYYVCNISPANARNVVTLVANHVNKEVTEKDPIVSAELPGSGFRFEGNIPPITVSSTFNIRKYSILDLSLDSYIEAGIMTERQVEIIKEAVKEHRNILVVGGTGSGKTTLCNAILNEMSKYNERIIIIQDTNELKCKVENRVFLRSTMWTTIRDLLYTTLRRTPTRIIIGEVRDGVALNLIKAWNTGHSGGLCTLHADSASLGLMQLESYISEATAARQEIAIVNTIDLVIDIQRHGPKRKVKKIIELKGCKVDGNVYLKGDSTADKYIYEDVV